MKLPVTILCFVAVLIVLPLFAAAEVLDGVNWADDVYAYTSNIQNYFGTLMDSSTEWWVTGAPDADADGNGCAWDDNIDPDYVAGWRGGAQGENIIVHFDAGLKDHLGDDLTVCLYSGSDAECEVLASSDGVSYASIGSIGGGTAGDIRNETFDFGGQFAESVHYVKVLRVKYGTQTGMFFDAFGGTAVPEPGSAALLSAAGLIGLLACFQRKRKKKTLVRSVIESPSQHRAF